MQPPTPIRVFGPAREIRTKLNELLQYAKTMVVRPSMTVEPRHTRGGQLLKTKKGGLAGDSGNPIKTFSIFEITDRSLKCYGFTGGGAIDSSGKVYYVRRPDDLRITVPGNVADDDDGTHQKRKKIFALEDDEGETNNVTGFEVITPLYAVGSRIFGFKLDGAGFGKDNRTDVDGTKQSHQDINTDGRHWILEEKLAKVCVDDETKVIVHYGTPPADLPT